MPQPPSTPAPRAPTPTGYSRTFVGWTIWRERPVATRQLPVSTVVWVVALAACTSGAVSFLTFWSLSAHRAADTQMVGTVTVSYEPLDAAAPQEHAADPPAPIRSASRQSRGNAGVAHNTTMAAGSASRGMAQARRTGLFVSTDPEGARVTINGMGWGTTPMTVRNLPAGTKRIRVTKAGYESEERIVGADVARAAVTLRIRLRELPIVAARQ